MVIDGGRHVGGGRAANILIAVFALAGGFHSSVNAQPGAGNSFTLEQSAAAFGARETVMGASLSPDGQMFTTIESIGASGAAIKVLDLSVDSSRPVSIASLADGPEGVNWCRWSGARRLLCSIYSMTRLDIGDLTYFTRVMAMDADGKRPQLIQLPRGAGGPRGYRLHGGSVVDWNTGKDGHVLMVRSYTPETVPGTRMVAVKDGLGVDLIDTINLRSTRVERPDELNREFISDHQGRIRIRGVEPALSTTGQSSGRTLYQYNGKDDSNWRTLSEYNSQTGEGFNPYFVDPNLNVAYGLRKLNGRDAAYSISLDGQKTETLLLERPDVDVDGFVTIGRSSRAVGVSYTTDKSEVIYFDKDLARLGAGLSRGLPNLPLVRFVDASQDERKLLIWAGSDVDPGRYYLLDRDTRALTELAHSRTPLVGQQLATVKHIEFTAADGTKIPGYLTLPPGSDGRNIPAIVMPHGGPSARDYWGFDWLSQFWANRGYAVLQPNFRGSSGYGEAWFQNNGFQGWETAIGDVVDAGRWLVSQGIADPKKLAIAGWSYGGYAALQSAVVQPDLFRAVIAIAPVTDLGRLKEEWVNWSNYDLRRDFIGSGPHIEQGSPARQAERIKVPVLLFHGTFDRNVNVQQSRLMADRLQKAGKSATLVVYDKLDHYLDDSEKRREMLVQSAKFLEDAFAAAN